jgi:uncharacterized membrane protein YgdD (TMEM256/DUF423 family)
VKDHQHQGARMAQSLILLAGLMGATGIALSAAAAHGQPGIGLDSAGTMLLAHAAAILGGLAMAHGGFAWRPLALVALAGFVLGAGLFSGDVALRAFAGHRLFPMAAPAGGMILIASWLALSGAAVAALVRGA